MAGKGSYSDRNRSTQQLQDYGVNPGHVDARAAGVSEYNRRGLKDPNWARVDSKGRVEGTS